MVPKRIGLVIYTLFKVSVLFSQDICSDIDSDDESDYGYRSFEGKCEGLYLSEISVPDLAEIRSFTFWYEPDDYKFSQDFTLNWKESETLHYLRSESLTSDILYRMDSKVSSSSYTWKTKDVLRHIDLTQSEIGILCWKENSVGETRRNVYLPLEIDRNRNSMDKTHYRLVIWTWEELKSISASIYRRSNDEVKLINDKIEPEYSFHFGTEEPIMLKIPSQQEGLYFITISLESIYGGGSSLQFWFEV